MAERIRNDAEIARDRVLIADLWLQEVPQQEIADRLNARTDIGYHLSDRMISYDVKQLTKAWQEEQLFDTHQAIMRSVKELEQVKLHAWRSWQKSLEPHEREHTQSAMRKDEDGKNHMVEVKAEKWISEGMGDPRFLDVILKSVARRDKLLGLEKLQIEMQIEKTVEHHVKTYRVVSPGMWDDPSIQVVDGEVVQVPQLEDGIKEQ